MNDKHKWIILAAETTGKKYALDKLATIYKDIRDDDPRLTTPSALSLLSSLEHPPIEGVRLVCYTDPEYPEKLKILPEPPAQLYLRGSAEALRGDRR